MSGVVSNCALLFAKLCSLWDLSSQLGPGPVSRSTAYPLDSGEFPQLCVLWESATVNGDC